jgi:hypothetical protein
MGKVINLAIREKKHELERCGGCQEPLRENEEYLGVTLPYENYDKQILLCRSCVEESRKQGIL